MLSALRQRSGVLPSARGRRGKGLHRRPARRTCVRAFGIRAQHRAVVTTVLTDSHGASGAHHRFRAALRAVRPHVPSAAADAHHRADRGSAAHHDPLPPDLGLRPGEHAARFRLEPHPLYRRRDDPPDHRRAALLYRPRIAVRADASAASGVRRRHAVRGRIRGHLPRVLRPHPRTTGRNGSGGSASPTTGRTR